MGNGASHTSVSGASPPRSASASAPRKQKVLVNAVPRSTSGSFRGAASSHQRNGTGGGGGAKAGMLLRQQQQQQQEEAKSASLQRVANLRKRRLMETIHTDDDAIYTLTRNADPTTLRVLELLQQAQDLPETTPVEKLRIFQQCYPLLELVPKERFDQVAVIVYQREGDVYYSQGDMANAKETYTRAITLAEKRVARGEQDLYMVLKRYVLAMVGMARVWYEHERDHKGFAFVDQRHPRVLAADGSEGDTDDRASSLSSLASSMTSDGGSVFSLNEAMLRSIAPREPRRFTGPHFSRVRVTAPHTMKNTRFSREAEFVLNSRMTRELIASPCELLLLRCCEVVEIGHSCTSELLIPALIELAQIYEDLELYSRALLLIRRCLGILCSVYDYDHPWVIQLSSRTERLEGLLNEQLRQEMATKIQSTWRMHKAMEQLADALGRPVHRHLWIPRKYRASDTDFLDGFLQDMPPEEMLGDGDEEEASPGHTAEGSPPLEEETPDQSDPHLTTEADWELTPPQPQRPSGRHGHSGDDEDDGLYDPYASTPVESPGSKRALYPTPVFYAPVAGEEGGETFTTMIPNAAVIGTTQDTQTDTEVRHTDYGDVLTVRTTTVTKTITENLSGEEEEEETEEAEEEKPEAGLSPVEAQQMQPYEPMPSPQEDWAPLVSRTSPQPPDMRDEAPSTYRRHLAPPPPPAPAPAPAEEEAVARHSRADWPASSLEDADDYRAEATPPQGHPHPAYGNDDAPSSYGGPEAGVGVDTMPERPINPLPEYRRDVPPPLPMPPPSRRETLVPSEVDVPLQGTDRSTHRDGPLDRPPNGTADDLNGYEAPRSEVMANGQPYPYSSLPPYKPDVLYNFNREPLRDLVEPNELFPMDSNGYPSFLPPVGTRREATSTTPAMSETSGPASQPLRQSNPNGNGIPSGVLSSISVAERLPLTVRQPEMNSRSLSRTTGPPPPPPPPQPPRRTIRDYTVKKTRITRTYIGSSSSSSGGGSAKMSSTIRSSSITGDDQQTDDLDNVSSSTFATADSSAADSAERLTNRPRRPTMPRKPNKAGKSVRAVPPPPHDQLRQYQPSPLPPSRTDSNPPSQAISNSGVSPSQATESRSANGYDGVVQVDRKVHVSRDGKTIKTARRYTSTTS